MWSSREQENLPSKPSSGPEQASGGSIGAVTSLTVIGNSTVIHGEIWSRESLRIDGRVDGTLDMPECRLTIARFAKVDANIIAREVEIHGNVVGNVNASKNISVRKGGRLVGDLRTPAITIEDGAYFKGRIEIVSAESLMAPHAPSDRKPVVATSNPRAHTAAASRR